MVLLISNIIKGKSKMIPANISSTGRGKNKKSKSQQTGTLTANMLLTELSKNKENNTKLTNFQRESLIFNMLKDGYLKEQFKSAKFGSNSYLTPTYKPLPSRYEFCFEKCLNSRPNKFLPIMADGLGSISNSVGTSSKINFDITSGSQVSTSVTKPVDYSKAKVGVSKNFKTSASKPPGPDPYQDIYFTGNYNTCGSGKPIGQNLPKKRPKSLANKPEKTREVIFSDSESDFELQLRSDQSDLNELESRELDLAIKASLKLDQNDISKTSKASSKSSKRKRNILDTSSEEEQNSNSTVISKSKPAETKKSKKSTSKSQVGDASRDDADDDFFFTYDEEPEDLTNACQSVPKGFSDAESNYFEAMSKDLTIQTKKEPDPVEIDSDECLFEDDYWGQSQEKVKSRKKSSNSSIICLD